MKKLVFIILFSLIFVAQFVDGCTLKSKPFTDFDSSEYIFIGEVIGYSETLNFNRKQNHTDTQPNYEIKFSQANGLKVKVKEFVNLPKTPMTHFEVFPFHVGSNCETLGLTKSEIEESYPLNSEILVIANEANIFPHQLPDGNFRLEEVKPRNIVVSNIGKNNRKRFSIDGFFDYQKNNQPKGFRSDDYIVSRFELRKDLLRLKKSEELTARREILNRLLYYYKSYNFFDFYEIARKYLTDAKEVDELYKRHLRFSDFSEKVIQKEIERRHKLEQNKTQRRED